MYFAGGFFQGASEAPISESHGPSSMGAGWNHSRLVPAGKVGMKMGSAGRFARRLGIRLQVVGTRKPQPAGKIHSVTSEPLNPETPNQ
jgi:hypothetical protein